MSGLLLKLATFSVIPRRSNWSVKTARLTEELLRRRGRRGRVSKRTFSIRAPDGGGSVYDRRVMHSTSSVSRLERSIDRWTIRASCPAGHEPEGVTV